MNARMMIAIITGGMTLGALNGCTTQSMQGQEVSLGVMESSIEETPVSHPLCLSAGDTLGQQLYFWHVVLLDQDAKTFLAISD